jgi:hypothetical protein
MLEAIGVFFCSLNPFWIFMIFPLLFGTIALQCWWECRKEDKLEANPHRMNEGQYTNLNNKRFTR